MVRQQPGPGSLTSANRAWNWEWTPSSSSHFKQENRCFMVGLSFPMQSWTWGWIAASLCMRNPTPPSWYKHWNKCTRTPPPVPPVPDVQNDKTAPLQARASSPPHHVVSYSDISVHTKQKAAGLETGRSNLQGASGMLCSQTFAGGSWSTYHILDLHCCFG